MSIFLATLSAAIGDAKSFSRNLFQRIEPDWPLAALAICCFLCGVVLMVSSRKFMKLSVEQSDSICKPNGGTAGPANGRRRRSRMTGRPGS
jgi:hypothetical protein